MSAPFRLKKAAASKVRTPVFLKNYLLENYSFTDKRGNSAYSSWDRAYELWLMKNEEAEAIIAEHIANEDFAVIEEE